MDIGTYEHHVIDTGAIDPKEPARMIVERMHGDLLISPG
jgi:hypothetical protein